MTACLLSLASDDAVFEVLQAETGVEVELRWWTEVGSGKLRRGDQGSLLGGYTEGNLPNCRENGQMIGPHASSPLQEPAHRTKGKTHTKHTKRQQGQDSTDSQSDQMN